MSPIAEISEKQASQVKDWILSQQEQGFSTVSIGEKETLETSIMSKGPVIIYQNETTNKRILICSRRIATKLKFEEIVEFPEPKQEK